MLSLRPYQERCCENVLKALQTEAPVRVMMYAPTGAGKTEIAIAVIQALKNQERVWFLLDRNVLVWQTSQRFSSQGIEHGVLQADHEMTDLSQKVQIVSIQTLEARMDLLETSPPDLMIWDEAHAMRQSVLNFLEQNPSVKLLGMSASPLTTGLGKHYTQVINAATMSELEKQQYLSPIHTYVGVTPDMKGAKIIAGEWTDDEVASRGAEIVGDIVTTWVDKTALHFPDRVPKTLVFSANVAHGVTIEKAFRKAGHEFSVISYLQSDQEKKQLIDDFRAGKLTGLISTDVLTRGFDVPDCEVGISARPFRRSFSSYVQQRGRVGRIAPNKPFALWLDHSNNTLRFRDKFIHLYRHGVDLTDLNGGEKAEREDFQKLSLEEITCCHCGACVMPDAEVCWQCGQNPKPQRSSGVKAVEGELVLFDELSYEDEKETPTEVIDPMIFYLQCCGYAELNGQKKGRAYYLYIERFGEKPPKTWQALPALQPRQSTLNFIREYDRKYARQRSSELILTP